MIELSTKHSYSRINHIDWTKCKCCCIENFMENMKWKITNNYPFSRFFLKIIFAIKRPLWPLVGATSIALDIYETFILKTIQMQLEIKIYWNFLYNNSHFFLNFWNLRLIEDIIFYYLHVLKTLFVYTINLRKANKIRIHFKNVKFLLQGFQNCCCFNGIHQKKNVG